MIETERLMLRPFSPGDIDAFAALNADPDVMRYIGDGKPQTKEQTEFRLNAVLAHWKQHGFGLFTAIDKASGDFVGFCGLKYLDTSSEIEVGYRLAKEFWGRGLATEAARASLHYGFETLGLGRIVAVVQPENAASCRVIEKIGLRYVRDARFYDTNVKYFEITREEYRPDDSKQ